MTSPTVPTAPTASGDSAGAGVRATIIVPARLASTRLPGKVLLNRTGLPMVQHVVEAARRATITREIVVATDSRAVIDALTPLGTRCVMTREDHPNGTSRLAEAAAKLGLDDEHVVINAQGDEPEMPGEVIDGAARALRGTPGAVVGTVCTPLASDERFDNPNIVKVVRGLDGRALYFSRAPIPVDRDARGDAASGPMRHVGVYAYRVGFLKRYAAMASTPLERAESLEQLRVLEHGLVIGVTRCDEACGLTGIDTPEQYEEFVRRFRKGIGQ